MSTSEATVRKLFRTHGRKRYVGRYFFPPELRQHTDTLFALVVYVDDVADAMDVSPDQRLRRLDCFKSFLTQGSVDGVASDEAALLRSWEATAQAHGIPQQQVLDYLDGQQRAVVTSAYRGEEALRDYLDSVTLLPALWANTIFGGGPAAEPFCRRTIEAFQRIDFVWDISDDLQDDRLYVPLDAFGVTNLDQARAKLSAADSETIATLLQLVDQAAVLMESGYEWVSYLPQPARQFMLSDLATHKVLVAKLRATLGSRQLPTGELGFSSAVIFPRILGRLALTTASRVGHGAG